MALGLAVLAWPLPGQGQGEWTAYGPGARAQHSAAFDSATGQMIVFGGQTVTTNYNDLWVAVNVITKACPPCALQWNFASPTGTPPAPRFGHTAAYDSANSRMIVFGGALGSPTPCANDVWVLDHANGVGGTPNWTQLNPAGPAPGPREGHAAAYDPTTNSLIVFGGTDCNGNYFADVWVLSNANGLGGTPSWTSLSPSGSLPPARSNMAAAYNSRNGTFVLYAGTNGTPLGDVWVLSNANGKGGPPAWSQLSPPGTQPAARSGLACAFDSANDRLIIQGGKTTTGIVGDAWVLSNADGVGGLPSWTMLMPSAATTPAVFVHTAVYDPVSNQLVVFGGISNHAPTPITADDHMFVLTRANGLTPTGSPAASPHP